MTEMRHRLTGVHPDLQTAMVRILEAMTLLGHPMFVVEGVRSLERQRELYAKGRTAPGKVVTHVDGSDPTKARHSPQADGYGHAVDLAFQGEAPWAVSHPWPLLGAMARALGLRWGGDFKSLKGDLGHVEVP